MPADSHPDRRDPDSDKPTSGDLDWLQSQWGADSGEPAGDDSVREPPAAQPAASVGLAPVAPVVAPSAAPSSGSTAPEPAPAPHAGRIRTEIELEPAPWWTTSVQKPLIRTEEETRLMPAAALPPAASPAEPSIEHAAAASAAGDATASGTGTGGGWTPSRAARILIWVAAGLLAIVILVALFFLGQQLGGASAPAPAPSPTHTPTPTPTPMPTAEAVGPRPAGVHKWDTLGGGECLQPYTSPWEEQFTVVDCAAPHAAQLVYRGVFAGEATTTFPGEAALAAQINLLCSAPGVIDLKAAGGYPDLQLQGSYPITAEQWTSGPRHYYCFVSRSSGEPLNATIAGPGPAPAG